MYVCIYKRCFAVSRRGRVKRKCANPVFAARSNPIALGSDSRARSVVNLEARLPRECELFERAYGLKVHLRRCKRYLKSILYGRAYIRATRLRACSRSGIENRIIIIRDYVSERTKKKRDTARGTHRARSKIKAHKTVRGSVLLVMKNRVVRRGR